jgi:anti-anti-sigma regulatory factor
MEAAMLELAPGWGMEVERGPDWLFVRLKCTPGEMSNVPPLADHVWRLMEQHFTRRLVMELDEIYLLHSSLVGQLVLLHKRLSTQGGVMRLCGLSSGNQLVLRTCRLDGRFPAYHDRADAVRGFRPAQPR